MMQLVSYLSFKGNCEQAFRFYNQILGGEIVGMFPHAGSPAENSVPPEWRDKIMHAAMRIGDQWLMGGDLPPNCYRTPEGFSVSIQIDNPAEADRIFQALSEGGRITMPIQETFWAKRFGMLVDRFDVPWMVNCGKPM
jgi:PhnB protein